MRTLATLFCTLMLMSSASGQKARLFLKLEKGEIYSHITQSKTKLNQDVYGQKMEIWISIGTSMSFLVNASTRSGYEMTVRYDSMKITMGMPQGNMVINSENPDENEPLSQLLALLKDIPFQLTMDRKGLILEMENVDTLWEAAIDKYDRIPEAERKQIKSQLMHAFGEEARSSGIETVTAVFPEKAVKKGAKWYSITTKDMGMPFTNSNTFTYEGNEADLAFINVHSSIESTDKEAWVESNGMTVRYDLSGSASGKITLNKKSGWVSETTMEQNLEGITYVKDSEQIPGGLEIPMNIKSEIKITDE